jgi:hypothetical protein
MAEYIHNCTASQGAKHDAVVRYFFNHQLFKSKKNYGKMIEDKIINHKLISPKSLL